MTTPPPTTPRIRVTVLGLMQRADGKILVERGHDPSAGDVFYRALGGGVEFGEVAAEALKREFIEELGLNTVVGERRAIVENIFTYDGQPGHEIVFIYDLTPADTAFYAQEQPQRLDGGTSGVCWRSIEEIKKEGLQLYPAGMAALAA